MKTTRRSFLAACAALFLPVKATSESRSISIDSATGIPVMIGRRRVYASGRGSDNPLFSGEYLQWDGSAIYPWETITKPKQ